jgi:hypothetical protein
MVLIVAWASVPVLQAQEDLTRFELYGGYEYFRINVNSNVSGLPPSLTFNGNGGGGDFLYEVNHWFGVLGDVSGAWATNASRQGALIPYLFGPRASFLRRGKVVPFVQVLFGGVATSSGIQRIGWQNNFAMTAGGGIDIRVSKHFSVRPVQAEYFLMKIPDGLNNRQNNFRYGAGLVFRFG